MPRSWCASKPVWPRWSAVPSRTAAAPTTSEAEAPATGAGSKRVADENRKIWAVVGGLVFVALALFVPANAIAAGLGLAPSQGALAA